MRDELGDEERTLEEAIEANTRPWNGYWSWKDKPVGEHGAAREILTGAGIAFQDLVSRPEGQDPPDCEAMVDGHPAGIEVTELVHEQTLKRAMRARNERAQGRVPKRSEAYYVWDQAALIGALQSRIDVKDRAEPKGGPYGRYILVIHTDEMFLEARKVTEWLAGNTFRANLITDVLFGLSYDPAEKRSPVFQLRICRPDRP
jgi:hypothetical protein